MLKEENIRAFEDDELIKRYEKWEEHFFEVIIIIHDEILRRGFEINKEVEDYIKTQVKKIRKEYKSFSTKELKEEFKRIDSLSYYNQIYLEKEIKNRKIKESSITEESFFQRNKYTLISYSLIVLIYLGISMLKIGLHWYFGKMGLLSEGYLRVESYFFDFINTIPLVMLLQLSSNYKKYYARTGKYYHVTLNQVFYLTIFFNIFELIFNLISQINLYLAIAVSLYFAYKVILAPLFIVDENMQLSFAIQNSINFTKEKPKTAIKLFFIILICLTLTNLFAPMLSFFTKEIFVILVKILILALGLKLYYKTYNKS